MEYDPSSYEVQEDPFPTYRWPRDHAPLYRNDVLDFWALSRFDDVHAALADHETYSSAEGVQLESSAANLGFQAEMMADHQIAMFDLLLAVAGYETSSKLIANAVVLLERFPDERRCLLDDPGLIPNAVDETLRYDGSTHYTARVNTAPATWHGRTVPAGSRFLLLMGAANRDDREFADPDRFDVGRDVRRHLGFGHGIHFCLGASLARLEGRVALEELLARFPDFRVDLDALERKYSSNFRGLSKVPVVLR